MDSRIAELVEKVQHMLATGTSIEDILSFLRQSGCSKVESIVVIKETNAISLAEAKKIIHYSKAWEDTRERDETFQDTFFNTIKNVDVKDMS
jgi:ribosomal protein L7/L12